MEYRKRCKVCGKIWCYTDEDLKSDSLNRLAGTASVIGGIANLLGGGSIFHQQYFADRAEHSSDQIVDRFQCPHCHSRDIENLTKEEWEAAQRQVGEGFGRIAINSNATPEALLRRARLFLEDGDWASAKAYCENVLDADPENAQAYVTKLMAKLKVKEQDNLGQQEKPFDDLPDYQKALRFSDDALAVILKGYIEQINQRIKQEELEAQYKQACATLASAETEEDCRKAAALFAALSDYKDATAKEAACHEEMEQLQIAKKKRLAKVKKFGPIVTAAVVAMIAAALIISTVIIPDSQYKAAERRLASGDKMTAAAEFKKLKDYKDAKERSAALWAEIAPRATVAAGSFHTVGLKSDGTVAAIGYNDDGQRNVSDWTDIVAVAAGHDHTVGLKADGTVVATGNNEYGQCDVSGWADIVAVAAGSGHTVGLRSDGTVVATGDNLMWQCSVSHWADMVAVSAGSFHTVGLRLDGTVVATGDNHDGQCDISDWTDIVTAATGSYRTVGVKSDGTVVATGAGQRSISSWSDIVAVATGSWHIVGLKSDDTVVATDNNLSRQCDVSDWTDIVAVSAGSLHTVGLRSDGTVVATGDNDHGQCYVSGWTDIKVPK